MLSEMPSAVLIHSDSDTYLYESTDYIFEQTRPTYDTEHTVKCKHCRVWKFGHDYRTIPHKAGCVLVYSSVVRTLYFSALGSNYGH